MSLAIIASTVLLGVALLSAVAVALALKFLLRWQILDHPNERTNHTLPTPRGGGLALIAILLPAWLIIDARAATDTSLGWILPVGALCLAAISWLDDLRDIGPIPRLMVQLAAAAAAVAIIDQPVFQGILPLIIDRLAAVFLLVWFINLFNFMDGIDGLSAVQAATIGVGLFLFGMVLGQSTPAHWQALIIAGAALGFLIWNWHPARIFLGDVGSIPIGFLLGWLLLHAASQGAWAAALILPSYYLADGTITLLRRLAAGQNVLVAHKQHFYQQAVQRGHSHAKVAGMVTCLNTALIPHALIVVAWPAATLPAFISATALVIGTLVWMAFAPARH